jgi:50S ribosomal subunit-associated GTPase HflX
VTEIEKAFAEENNPLGVHFDASKEIRAKGAGFYQFSADEETRKAQMEELKASREETERARQGTGALDLKPGEVEGMHEVDVPGSTGTKSRAMEKRKRELEERRKLIEAKRRKVDMPAANMMGSSTEPAVPGPSTTSASVPVPNDPFATLEVQSSSKAKDSGKAKTTTFPDAYAAPVLEADAFLSQLEEVFLVSMKKNR